MDRGLGRLPVRRLELLTARARGALLLLLAGCTPARTPLRAAITHGAPDDGDAAVVALRLRPAVCGAPIAVTCTGTLIAPRAVLTAAHCLDETPLGAAEAYFGADAIDPSAAGSTRALIAAVRHPDPAIDLAVIALDAPADATPVRVRDPAAGAPTVGATVRLVGFGADENRAIGRKREGTATVESVAASDFRVGPAPALSCGGDSGGPVLLGDEVAGVTSYGDAACAVSGTNVRTDVQAAFLSDALAQVAALPVAAGRPPIDEHTDYCHRACATDGDCPAGMTCSDGLCALLGLPPGTFGAPCSASDACTCAQLPTGCRCLEPCTTKRTQMGCSFSGF